MTKISDNRENIQGAHGSNISMNLDQSLNVVEITEKEIDNI